ncbi:MAG: substrate-binding domain-containing protein, partial [Deinococcota bacterium]
EKYNYLPNMAANALFKGTSKTIAVIIGDITNPFTTTLVRGVEDVANKHGYVLLLGNTDDQSARERSYVELALAKRADGVVLSPSAEASDNIELLLSHNMPLVLIDRKPDESHCDIVRGDSYKGGYLISKHLCDKGYKRIAFVGGLAKVSSLQDRLQGYCNALEEAKLDPIVRLGRYDRSSGYELSQHLIAENVQLDAMVTANNHVALGAYRALREHGLSIPADIALVTFDDISDDYAIDPFLTSVIQPAYDMGARAMDMLLDRIHGRQLAYRDLVLPIKLIERRSS